MLYADTPIDASLLSLYIHQNYTQYCATLDECEALMDSLSWVDASGGENVSQPEPSIWCMLINACDVVVPGESAPVPPCSARDTACPPKPCAATQPEAVQACIL